MTNKSKVLKAMKERDGDECRWHSSAALSEASGVSRRVVQNIIQGLLQQKHIEKQTGGDGRGTMVYKRAPGIIIYEGVCKNHQGVFFLTGKHQPIYCSPNCASQDKARHQKTEGRSVSNFGHLSSRDINREKCFQYVAFGIDRCVLYDECDYKTCTGYKKPSHRHMQCSQGIDPTNVVNISRPSYGPKIGRNGG